MTESGQLDIFIVDDNDIVCELLSEMVKGFYVWGQVHMFTDAEQAIEHSMNHEMSIAIFVVDVFLGGQSGFYLLDCIEEKFPSVYEDTIIITGHANTDIVNMCLATNVHYLLEKPIKSYSLQLSIKAIVSKYLKYTKKLTEDPEFAKSIERFKSLPFYKL